MKKLEQLVAANNATTRPADEASIKALQNKLGFDLSDEYISYLKTFGTIDHDGDETYGLGVPEDYYLNVMNIYNGLKTEHQYPNKAVPLLEIGDGHYYLYDNSTHKVLVWAKPNGGVVRVCDEGLEAFLSQKLFGQ